MVDQARPVDNRPKYGRRSLVAPSPMRCMPRCGALLLAMLTMLAATQKAMALDWGEEYAKRIKATELTQPLGDSTFGEQINLFNGTVSFSATDISLPGNNTLPVELKRIYNTQDVSSPRHAGVWDIDVPHLSSVHPDRPSFDHWAPLERCSTVAAPPSVGTGSYTFLASDYWSGHQLSGVAGGGSLRAITTDPRLVKPATGGPYRWMTDGYWYFSCIPGLASGVGEGFVGLDPNGNQYRFDWLTARDYPGISRKDPSILHPAAIARKSVRIYATEVKDRFGNWVRYDWTGGRLNRIYSNDGRDIRLTYHADGRLNTAYIPATATTSQRLWTYEYSASNLALESVLTPDGTRWRYANSGTGRLNGIDYETGPDGLVRDDELDCSPTHLMQNKTAGFTITHPSGASAYFLFAPLRHGRTNVRHLCKEGTDDDWRSNYNIEPTSHDVMSLQTKAVSGIGFATQTFTYQYASLNAGYRTPGAPAQYKYVTVNQPDGVQTVHTFGKDAGVNEGQLFKVETKKGGVTYRTVVNTYVTDAEAPAQQFPDLGSDFVAFSDAPPSPAMRPLRTAVVTLPTQSATFTRQVPATCGGIYCFDALARETATVKSSSGLGASYSKTETTTYHDNLSKWVVGQVATQATNGIQSARTDYDANAMPWKTWAFGKLQQTLTYETAAVRRQVRSRPSPTATATSSR